MRSPTWAEVVLAAVGMVQTVGLAWIARRGVVLPPTNRRRPHADRRASKRDQRDVEPRA